MGNQLGELLDAIASSQTLSADAIRLFLVLLRDPFLKQLSPSIMTGPIRKRWLASRLGMDPELLDVPAAELGSMGVVTFDQATDTYTLDLSKVAPKSRESHRELERNPQGQFSTAQSNQPETTAEVPVKSRGSGEEPDNGLLHPTTTEGKEETYCRVSEDLTGTSPGEPLEPEPGLLNSLLASGAIQQGTAGMIPDAPMLFPSPPPEPEPSQETTAQRRARQEKELAALILTWEPAVRDAFADWRIAINAARTNGEARVGFMLRLAKEVDGLIPALGDHAVAYGISQATTVPESGPADNSGYVKKAARSYVRGQDSRIRKQTNPGRQPSKAEVGKYADRA